MNVLGIFPAFRPPDYNSPVGGGEISNRQLLECLAALGHRVVVYAINAGHGGEWCSNGIEVIDGGVGRRGALAKVNALLRVRRGLSEAATRFHPDVILTSTGTAGMAQQEGRRLRAPVAVFVRALKDMDDTAKKLTAKQILKRVAMGTPNWAGSPCLIANSHYILDACRKRGFEGMGRVVYPPMEVDPAAREWPSVIRTIGMMGSSGAKGGHVFLELARQNPGVRFVVIGDRSVPANDEYTHDNVTRYGWSNNPLEILDSCDAILMPTQIEEAFGRAAVEAIVRKKFVLVSRSGGLPEAVPHDDLLIDPFDLPAWKERLSDLMARPTSYRPAMEHVSERAGSFTLPRQGQKLERVLVELRDSVCVRA